MDNTQLGIVIATNPVDGSTATSFLPVGHKGRCAVKCEGSKRDHWSILPSPYEAFLVAGLAIRDEIGGYGSAEVHLPDAAPDGAKEYESSEAWMMD
ncbi:hypothetical protein VDG03_18375 [Xanthomonas campestris pv. raphani]|uniref:hypothetical protein n=1 Tax=Xanthomonas campestris TaxID=339 RepID=UPI001F3BDB72|nr:hypothetical protein [Xanthomonas campestris]MCF8828575.1 hypothetical protein [Xanthomonas campestris pv. raphani]MEA9752943.1 hypothetical protein [Xanthomonas campestris pv. raphani]MEA9813175.1 hypothetical protein [Xanthomonas campestris pv. raphani]MEA9935302.1 hypothetical protein [Xanthomonas campestris pv. raphani]WDJ08211.1 hypothetical protein JH261_20835 [Xanthomonas campestris pv. incanae]